MKIMLPDRDAPTADWAMYYAQIGWLVLPLHYPDQKGRCSCSNSCSSVGKHPLTSNGVIGASNSIITVRKWWAKWPNANIGIATGQKTGLLVVDVDARHGGLSSLDKWESKHKTINTLRSATGGNGQHLFFLYPNKTIIKNRVNLVSGIDIRSNGGYVVAPPSMHASGQGYTWKDNQNISETPPWLISYLTKQGNPAKKISIPSNISEGSRNSFLASMAGSFRKQGLSASTLEGELQLLNTRLCSPPLEGKEVENIAWSISTYPSEKSWGPIEEIPEEKYQIPNMDESFLPGPLKPWAADITKRMQVPVEFIAAPAIVALSSLIGRKIGIYPKQHDDWLVLPNLWGAVIARPGFFKSPTIAEAMKPLEKIISRANEDFDQKKTSWEMEKSINEAAIEATKDQLIKAIKKGQDVDIDSLRSKMRELKEEIDRSRPIAKRYKSNDATIEKIANLMIENPNGFMILRDELYGWLASLNKSGREGDREFYLESWNGYGSFTVDRIGRGTTHIPSLCLSIFGGIQPSKLEKYVLDTMEDNDDGLLQRFQILIYPEITKEWKNYDVCPNVKAKEKVNQLFESFCQLEQKESPMALHFDEDAQIIFNEWRANLEARLRSGKIENPSYESHLAKYRSLMPSLALIFHLLEHHNDADDSRLDSDSANLAIKWCEFLDSHAQKIYKVSSSPQKESAKALAHKIKANKVSDKDNLRSIYRHHWSHLDSTEKLDGAIKVLTELNWLRIESQSGKRTKIIRLNPEL